MSKFSKFMKSNKQVKENVFFAATASLCDENGQPLLWEFRHITSREADDIRGACIDDVPTGRPNVFRPKFDANKFVRKIITASVVMPDLYDAELQDSYGVNTPEDLLMAMVDDPGEYTDLGTFIQKFQGFEVSFEDKVEEAKN